MLAFKTGKVPVGCDEGARDAVMGNLDFIDNGLFKRVYKSPDGTCVYKVSRGYNPIDEEVSEGRRRALVSEAAWAAYGRKTRTPGIPHVTLYVIDGTPVLAMPFLPMDSYDLDYDLVERHRNRWERMGLSDLHEGNIRGDAKGRPVVCDLGAWSDDYPTSALPDGIADLCMSSCDEVDDEDYEDNRHDEDCLDSCCHEHYTECGCTGHHYEDCECYACRFDRHTVDACDPDDCAFAHHDVTEGAE